MHISTQGADSGSSLQSREHLSSASIADIQAAPLHWGGMVNVNYLCDIIFLQATRRFDFLEGIEDCRVCVPQFHATLALHDR